MFNKILPIIMSFLMVMIGFIPPGSSYAQDMKKYTIAVLDLDANGISESEARSLSNYLRGQVAEEVTSEKYKKSTSVIYSRIVERSQMDKIFEQFNIQNTGCTDVSCAIELGKMLNVERIVIGSVGLVGETYSIQARIVDIESSEIVASSNYVFTGQRDNLLKEGIPKIVNDLVYGKEQKKSRKKLYIIAGAVIVGGVIAVTMAGDDGSSGGSDGTIGVTVEFPE